jgi:hypothetical protein
MEFTMKIAKKLSSLSLAGILFAGVALTASDAEAAKRCSKTRTGRVVCVDFEAPPKPVCKTFRGKTTCFIVR